VDAAYLQMDDTLYVLRVHVLYICCLERGAAWQSMTCAVGETLPRCRYAEADNRCAS